jgi:beta-lactam-binding protein with PASTA domain
VETGISADAGLDRSRMPALVGQRLRQALAVLAAYDVQVEVHGQGVVVAQQPVAGSEIGPGTVCRLDLARQP